MKVRDQCDEYKRQAEHFFIYLSGYANKTANSSVKGSIGYSETTKEEILQPFHRKLMDDTNQDLEIDWISLERITGNRKAVNELLDFVNDKIAKTGVTEISFSRWGTIDGDGESQIMTENLTVIANKTKQLKKLQITEM